MKILIIAMSDSIHTARWINQIADEGWEIHLFPSIDVGLINPELRNAIVYDYLYTKTPDKLHPKFTMRGIYIPFNPSGISNLLIRLIKLTLTRYFPTFYIHRLRYLIKKIKPDIIHSIEFQHAGYLTLDVLHKPLNSITLCNVLKFLFQKFFKLTFIRLQQQEQSKDTSTSFSLSRNRIVGESSQWIVTSWGSDIYLYGRLNGHREKIKELLTHCDFFSCGCSREIQLVKSLGFNKKILPVFPNTGGFDLEEVSKLRQPGPTSKRRLIMLKGYQHWAGRALVGLRALERCADLLEGYTIAINIASPDVAIAAELFEKSTGIPVKIIHYGEHKEILRYHGQARISIGLSISDGLPGSFLEALVMGSFPIQSWTACADEWIEHGKTGILVPPEDPDVIEKAIRRALTDDELVNQAAERNYRLAEEKLDESILKPKAIEFYYKAARGRGSIH